MTFQPTYDLSGKLNPTCYAQGRGDLTPVLLVCHSTCGPNDDNSIIDPVVALARSNAAANYLCNNDRQVSVQWLIGAEAAGAPTYRIVPENDTAYHAGGMPGYPSAWADPATKTRYTGVYAPLDCSIINVMSIGIEIFGQVHDMLGPNQRKAVTALVQDIVSRYPIMAKPGHIVSHASLEADRQDGRNWVALAGAAASQYTTTKVPTMPPPPLPPISVTNPKGLGVGGGVLAAMAAHGDTAQSDELYFVPKPGQRTDVTLCSITWGAAHMYVSTPNPDGTWRVRVLQEI